ncbi:MAG: SHOCT domain-containing protein [Polaromonas sp.]|nr:SHOCT domain-containing protein [Polaromonas sp.]
MTIIAALSLAGCASITGTTNQNVSVQTKESTGTELVGASCELSNKKGKWFITTPGSVGISRSNDDIQVSCTKAGYLEGKQGVVSDTKGMMFGNIIFGGGIGAIIDHTSGAAYEYPSAIQVVMSRMAKLSDAVTASLTPTAATGIEKEQPKSKEGTLGELKALYDKKLITKENYEEQQKKILSQ